MGVLSIEYNINYRACLGSLIYILYTTVAFFFAVHKLANPGKVNYEGLVQLLKYVRDNNNLVLK